MYEWLKAAHVVAVLLFSGGLIGLCLVSIIIGARGPQDTETSARLRAAIRTVDRTITLPALVSVWVFGFWIATSGGWFSDPWLQIKLGFVFALSGLHGVVSGRLRRTDLDAPGARTVVLTIPVILTLVSFAVIAVLVIVKPF